MKPLIELITKQIELDEELRYRGQKNSFWPSETDTDIFDLYHKFIGTKETDPIDSQSKMMFQIAKMVEQTYVKMFDKLNLLKTDQERIDIEREGIHITGYIDAILYNLDDPSQIRRAKEIATKIGDDTLYRDILALTSVQLVELPVEIKSYYGDYQEKELNNGNPKESYLKQLAIYMDACNYESGILFYVNRGTGKTYQFELIKTDDFKYKCNNIEIDLSQVYKRWSKFYYDYVTKHEEPKPEFVYKYQIDKIDWNSISTSQISAARNNEKVIGDWQTRYSQYFQLHLQKEKTVQGYTENELRLISELTKGYTSKDWKKSKEVIV